MDEQTLAQLPAWVREIAEACESNHAQFFKGCGKSTVPMAGWYCPNCGGSATRRADIPRLIEAAAGMAEALEFALEDAGNCSERPCLTCSQSDCLCNVAALALAKYRGEASE